MTPPLLKSAHDRVQQDLAAAERQQRQAAERMARELAKVLQELAIIFDGDRLEALRREDPKVTTYWTADDWRTFFAEVPSPVKTGWAESDKPRIAELERTIAELKNRMAESQALLVKATASPSREEPAAAVGPQGRRFTGNDARKSNQSAISAPKPVLVPVSYNLPAYITPPLTGLLARSLDAWKPLPDTCPADFQETLSGGGRTGEDLKKAYQRYWLTLYLIGGNRLNAKLEIEDLLAMTVGTSSRAGSLGRIVEDLQQAGILAGQLIRIGLPKTSLRLLRLSPDGIRLFKILYQREPEETDWERMIRLHEGERFPVHTLAVLVFALHARKRGWATQILPPVEGTRAVPDLLVLRGEEKLYVEVELGQKESPTKWRNQAELNNGRVALCAATPKTRQRLAGDCRLAKLPGLATDLDTLIKVKHSIITDQNPLWAESW